MGFFGGAAKGLENLQDRRRQQQTDQIDQLTKYAALSEAGYKIQPTGQNRMFGGQQMSLVQDPSFQGTKTLQRRKLELENQKLEAQNRMFGAAGSANDPAGSGTSAAAGENVPFVMTPFGQKTNPAYLNPLEKEKLAGLQNKKQQEADAQQNKNEMVRQDAEGQLAAIQEAKKGIKYFGPMGNLPSVAAPSSLFGQYGPRKEWENNTNKLLAGRVMEVMNKMKQASKTGATGFGQLNRSELALIQNASNVLSKDLPPDIAEKYLNQLEPIYQKVLAGGQKFGQGGVAGKPQQEQGGGQPDLEIFKQSVKQHYPELSDTQIEEEFRRRAGV